MSDDAKSLRGIGKKAKPVKAAAPDAPADTTTSTGDTLRGLPEKCPITPLGLMGEVRYYLDADKQFVALPSGEHTRSRMIAMFGHQSEFIYGVRRWTRRNPEGEVSGIRPELIMEDLFKACSRAGIIDVEQRVRGRGAWRNDDDSLVLHNGDRIMVFGLHDPWALRMVQQPGTVGGYIYPAGERCAEPAAEDTAKHRPDPADVLLTLLETWNWRRQDLDATLLLGWIAAAMIGGALEWRPAVWLTGGKGTGKSTLQAVIKHVLGNSVLALANTTPAAVWQTLQHSTLPVALDEMEATEDNRRALGVVELARLAASGGKMARGSDRHSAVTFTLRSCFVFSSVLVPPLMGPDRSRIAMLELGELAPGATVPAIDRPQLAAIGAQLRRRLVIGWRRHRQTLDFYREQLANAGHSQRGADQFGTLLACADLVLWPDGTDARIAADWISRLAAATLQEISDDMRDEQQCLQHLLGSPIDPFRRGERATIGEWINRAAGRYPDWEDARAAHRVLQQFGVRLDVVANPNPSATEPTCWVAVANNHVSLAALFERTRWAAPRGTAGVWTQALRRLPGAEQTGNSLWFGGSTSRAVMLPLKLIPSPDVGTTNPFEQTL